MKLISKTIIFFSIVFFLGTTSFAGDVLFQIENFSPHTHKMLADDGKNVIYNVFINRVQEYLPTQYGIKHKIIKSVDAGIVPGKSILKIIRHLMVIPDPTVRVKNSKAFFEQLEEGEPHTYAITPYHLIFTESTGTPMEEQCKDKLSKHYFISDLAHKVNFAGQFYVYKNPENGDVAVVFDNSSGTYRPENCDLEKLKNLLDANFSDDGLLFLTTPFDKKIDREMIFLHGNELVEQRFCIN